MLLISLQYFVKTTWTKATGNQEGKNAAPLLWARKQRQGTRRAEGKVNL